MVNRSALTSEGTGLMRRHHGVVARRVLPPAFAAIDLGTNSCRMLSGVPSGRGFRVLDRFSRVVRLGDGLYQTGILSETAMLRAINAWEICAERLRQWQIRDLRAIATGACRQAENGTNFVHRARADTGLPIEIVSPREEMRLALESCASLVCRTKRRALLFDIGRGSTDLAWVRVPANDDSTRRMPELIGCYTVPIGVATLAERCNGWCETKPGFARVVEEVRSLLGPFEQTHRISQEIRQGGVRLVGTSGTVTTVAGMALKLQRYQRTLVDGTILSQRLFMRGVVSIRSLGREGLAQHPCVGPARADFILPGCAILLAIAAMWPVQELAVADRGLREGMLLQLIESHRRRRRRTKT